MFGIKDKIKRKIREAGKEVILELIEVLTTAEYKYNPKTKEFSIRLTKEF